VLGLPIRSDPRLRERHYGEFEGRTIEEIARLFPESHARYVARNPEFAARGGESTLGKHARVLACLGDLVGRHRGGRIIVVTHGGVLDSLYRYALELPYPAPRPTPLLNGSRNVFRVESGRWTLVVWGVVPPLEVPVPPLDLRA
jgi:probable phosphoglycerate mutase